MHDIGTLLEGRLVRLREMRESDAPFVVEWRNRPEIREWLIQWEPLTVERHLAWAAERTRLGDLLVMFETLSGNPVGSTSLQDFDRPRTSAEWGRLCSAQIGKHSYEILEGCYLLHLLSFEALGMFRLSGSVATSNERAWRIYQFLGYQEEGVRRRHWAKPDGTYFDARVIGCFPDEFRAARPALEAKLYEGGAPSPKIDPEAAARMRRHFRIGVPRAGSHAE